MAAPIFQKKEDIYILGLDFGLFLKFFKTYNPKNLVKKNLNSKKNSTCCLVCAGKAELVFTALL